jgi:hypothetical protein
MNEFIQDPSKKTESFLGVAPIHYASQFHLDVLDGSDHSLNQIQSYFHNAINLTGREATRNNFLREFSNYSIIQLYTASDTVIWVNPSFILLIQPCSYRT